MSKKRLASKLTFLFYYTYILLTSQQMSRIHHLDFIQIIIIYQPEKVKDIYAQ